MEYIKNKASKNKQSNLVKDSLIPNNIKRININDIYDYINNYTHFENNNAKIYMLSRASKFVRMLNFYNNLDYKIKLCFPRTQN